MAKGVNDALADILVKHGKMQKSDALKLLVQWMNDKRYLRDLVIYLKLLLELLVLCNFILMIILFIFSGLK